MILTGSVTVKFVDLLISEVTSMLPLCACIIFNVDARPKPIPLRLEV